MRAEEEWEKIRVKKEGDKGEEEDEEEEIRDGGNERKKKKGTERGAR